MILISEYGYKSNNSFLTFSNFSLLLEIKHILKLFFKNSFAKEKPIPLLPPVIITYPSPYFSFKLFFDVKIYFLIKLYNLKQNLIITIIPIIKGIEKKKNHFKNLFL